MADSNENRKEQIRRRILLSRYPRRSAARFTDENDHNPLVLQDCLTCCGRGATAEYWSSENVSGHSRVQCPACDGSGVTGQVERYFPDDLPEAEARPDANKWLTCPRCRWRFSARDSRAWTGRRHVRCGQKIRLLPPAGTEEVQSRHGGGG